MITKLYSFQRAAMKSIIDKVKSVTDNVIIVGHVKDKSIVSAEGKEVGSVKDFDLTGKIYVYKKSSNMENKIIELLNK